MPLRLLVMAVCLIVYTAYPEVTFIADIEPLLKKRCQGCHGVQLQMGGLRLDNREYALQGGYSGPVSPARAKTVS